MPSAGVDEGTSVSSWRVLSGPRKGSTDFGPGAKIHPSACGVSELGASYQSQTGV